MSVFENSTIYGQLDGCLSRRLQGGIDMVISHPAHVRLPPEFNLEQAYDSTICDVNFKLIQIKGSSTEGFYVKNPHFLT